MKLTNVICPNCRGDVDIGLFDNKNSAICPYCDKPVYIDNETRSAFRQETNIHGKATGSPGSNASEELSTCPNCHYTLDSRISRGRQSFFCPNCGQRVASGNDEDQLKPASKKNDTSQNKKTGSDIEAKIQNFFNSLIPSETKSPDNPDEKNVIIGSLIVFGALVLIAVLILISGPLIGTTDNKPKTIYEYTPYSSEECIGKDMNAIIATFQAYGFTSITANALADLDTEDAGKLNLIESITINGDDDFDKDDKFKQSAAIIINYHSLKQMKVPLSSETAKIMDADEIKQEFEAAGFINVATSEIDDLDPDVTDTDYEIGVVIDGIERFDDNALFPLDSQVNIVTHRRYNKHNIKIIIDFTENLLFSTYDVEMTIGDHTEKLPHGKNAEFEYRLKEGEYTITFTSTESSSVNGSATINLTGETKVKYKISCFSDEVEVNNVYTENQGDVGENETMVPKSSSDCDGKNYKDIEKSFREAGFTNISYNILYDIFWGITEEGEIEKVSIDGDTKFKRGDVYAKDAPIVITYHMNEDDKPVESSPDDSSDEIDVSIPDEPDAVFYSTNDYETAKEGKSGIFSYKSKGGSYDVYWIIDFDAGYVYYFTNGNGNDICDKVKLSGTLNDRITVTWHYGSDEETWYLHFKYVNHPETLVVVDHFGTSIEFTTTDLDNALSVRNSKQIKDY